MGGTQGLVVRNLTRGTVVADQVKRARTSTERRRGLLGQSGLPAGSGLLIAPCEGVHSFWMKFAIDVVFLDKKWRVRKVTREMKPWRIALCLTAHSVLELAAGAAREVQVGDTLELI